MKLRSVIGLGVAVGFLLTVPLVAVMYLLKGLGVAFLPFDVFDWTARQMPGALVTFGIDTMVDALMLAGLSVADFAKTAEQILAVSTFVIGGVAATTAVFVVIERLRPQNVTRLGLICGAVLGLAVAFTAYSIAQPSGDDPTFAIAWALALGLAWGALSARIAQRLTLPKTTAYISEDGDRAVEIIDRRQFMIRMGAATAAVTVAGAGLGRYLSMSERQELEDELAAVKGQMAETPSIIELPNENDPIKPALGTRPEYTAVRDHYKVFIRSEPTRIEEADWTLPITGLVANPLTLTLEDIRNRYEPRDQFVTLSCISNRVGGDLISTTYWTGVSLQDILADVEPASQARYLHISSGDGFYETVDLELIRSDPRVMLAYDWDGRPIPFDHGFPLRIWIPDRFGMKQPKWITGIEVIGEYKEGYWVERGWSETALVRATSVVDTIAVDSIIEKDGKKLIPVGGIAFAGARGISKVEVRVDNGEWIEAELRSPLSETTWVIWRYDWPWPFEEGVEWEERFTIEVRCVEADGTPQIEEYNPPRPDGATGVHQRQETVGEIPQS